MWKARAIRARDAKPGMRLNTAASVCAGILLGGCAVVGPDFHAPSPPLSSGYAAPGDRLAAIAETMPGAPAPGRWWEAMGSPALNGVIIQALAHNQTLAAANATLEQARAQAEHERAALGPAVTAAAGYNRERINVAALGFPGFPSPTIGLYSVGPSVTYDLDLAGGERRRAEAARAMAEAQAYQADAAYLSLTGDVALAAVRIAGLRAEIDATLAVVADDRQGIEIARKAEAAGGESSSSGLGGKLQLSQDLALLPPLEDALAKARHELAILAGAAPAGFAAPPFAVSDFSPPATIEVVVPSGLVRRRPDIQAAEARLHADTAQVGVATAALYPDIRLTAGLTQEGLNPASLFSFGATAYQFGPSVTAPVFDGGARRAARRAAQAAQTASLARYHQTVIAAFAQVADALSALAEDEAALETLTRAEITAQASLEEARQAYALGGAPMSETVAADRRWREASLARIQAVGHRLEDIVALYTARGG